MLEIIWIGRGGQGAFTAAKLLGAAYVAKGETYHALAFPSFGPERRGAPVRAFTKLDEKPILDRSETEQADYILVLDETLYSDQLQHLLKENGKILVNTKTSAGDHVMGFDCDTLAQTLRLPVVNTLMLGVFSAVSGIVTPEELGRAIAAYMPEKIREKNQRAVAQAAGEVTV